MLDQYRVLLNEEGEFEMVQFERAIRKAVRRIVFIGMVSPTPCSCYAIGYIALFHWDMSASMWHYLL
jgi:hypothetical protein